MRVDPARDKKTIRAIKAKELETFVQSITRVLAIVIAFVSVFYFFIKLLYL